MELLNKLHRKVKSIDGYLDDRHEPSTTRRAWGEIRDSVERGANLQLSRYDYPS